MIDVTTIYHEKPWKHFFFRWLEKKFSRLLSHRCIILLEKPKPLFARLDDVIAQETLREGLFEKHVIEIATQLAGAMQNRKLYIDVGANIGLHTITIGSLFDRQVCLEPNLNIAPVLALNLRRYALPNARVETYALGDTEGEAEFFENDCGNLGNSTLEPREAAGKNMIVTRVSVKTGDRQFENEVPDFIKIDVEGFEPRVLHGLRETLNQHRPVLMVEIKVFDASVDLRALLPPEYTFHVITSDLAGTRRLERRLALWWRGREKYFLQQVSGVFEQGDDAVFCIPVEALMR